MEKNGVNKKTDFTSTIEKNDSWKDFAMASEPGPSNIKMSKSEIEEATRDSIYERVKRRNRKPIVKYDDENQLMDDENNKKATKGRCKTTKDNNSIRRTIKRTKDDDDSSEIEHVKPKRVYNRRGAKSSQNNKTDVNIEKNKKVLRKKENKKDENEQIENFQDDGVKQEETVKKNTSRITTEHQYIDVNIDNIISGKRRRKTVQTYAENVLSSFKSTSKKDTISNKENQEIKKFHKYIDQLLKKDTIDATMAEEFKKLDLKKVKVPKPKEYVNTCVVKENEKGGIPPCVVCNEISDVVLRCRWCRNAYHWTCYPVRLYQYFFPKRPWRCLICEAKRLTKSDLLELRKMATAEKNRLKKEGLSNENNFYDILLKNKEYEYFSKKNVVDIKYKHLFWDVHQKTPADFSDDSFSDSSDDDVWYRNSLYPQGLYGPFRKCCFICHEPETEIKHMMKCTFCRGQYHCDCLTPPFTYAPLGDFNCGYHINEPKKEPNLLSYDRVLDAIQKYNEGDFANDVEFEIEFNNAVKQIKREEDPEPLAKPRNFRSNVPSHVEKFYTGSSGMLMEHFENIDEAHRKSLKEKVKDDNGNIYDQYEQLKKIKLIEDEVIPFDEINESGEQIYENKMISIISEFILKVPLSAFIISESFSIRYFYYGQLYLSTEEGRLDVKINGPPYDNCTEFKERMVDIKFINQYKKYELFVIGRVPVFVNGIRVGKNRRKGASNSNCPCQEYFKLHNVRKAYVPSVLLKSGDIIRIGCCSVLFGHA
uniref:PHD-type domain-containing protein n=1 Tax=Parastrongyloides trichosuri TaxID=131310 RepID=A0A0N4ZBX5_PARTI